MEDNAVLSLASYPLADSESLLSYVKSLPQSDACILSSVSVANQEIVDVLMQKSIHFMELTAGTAIPIRNLYKTPETLGKDRLAAIVGAYGLFPGRDILVFDVGTALTIDFIDKDGNYRGGNISPGLNMRFRALHDYTQQLSLQTPKDDYNLLGDTTASAIVSGVQNGMVFEMNHYIEHFVKKNLNLVTIFTGGDIFFFVNKINIRIFAEPNLVLIGLNNIIKYNLK